MTDQAQPSSTPSAALPWFGIITAFALMLFFGWLTYQMFALRYDWTEPAWTRSMTIYGTIEAFALSAAGALMGVQIQSGRVRAAESRAEAKEKEADTARDRHDETKVKLARSETTIEHAAALVGREPGAKSTLAGGGVDVEALRTVLVAGQSRA